MPISILMPALSPTMTEGNLVKWLKKEGERINAGDVIAEIETDKATMEVEAVDEGTLGRIIVPAGSEKVAVNTPIGLILEEGEDAGAMDAPAPTASAPPAGKPAATPAPAEPVKQTSAPAPVQAASGSEKRVFASPLARRIATENNLDLQGIAGTGPQGRIVKADVEKTAPNRPAAAPLATGPDVSYVDRPLSAMRKVIAKRLLEAKQQVPHFYLTVDCNLDALITLRKQLNSSQDVTRLSINDFIIRATALALIQVPDTNVSWQETSLRYYQVADIAVAVAIDNGLITPILRNAESKSLSRISAEMKALVEKARAGKLAPDEFQGGTFTISNLGMYGIKNFGAIINPPQACILAVGAGEPRPVVRNNEIQVATQMTCTLSADHRAVDGSAGSSFLAAFKDLIENPLKLLL